MFVSKDGGAAFNIRSDETFERRGVGILNDLRLDVSVADGAAGLAWVVNSLRVNRPRRIRLFDTHRRGPHSREGGITPNEKLSARQRSDRRGSSGANHSQR